MESCCCLFVDDKNVTWRVFHCNVREQSHHSDVTSRLENVTVPQKNKHVTSVSPAPLCFCTLQFKKTWWCRPVCKLSETQHSESLNVSPMCPPSDRPDHDSCFLCHSYHQSFISNHLLSLLQYDKWRLSSVNRDYSVCPTYPPAVIVPKDISDDTLIKASKFRQGGRFPVLCYYHRKNGMVRSWCVRPAACILHYAAKPSWPDPKPFRSSCAAVSRWQEPIGSAAWRMSASFRLWSTAQIKVTSSTPGPVSRLSRPGWRVEGSSPNLSTAPGRDCTDRWKGVLVWESQGGSRWPVFYDTDLCLFSCVCVCRGKALQESLIKLVEACGDESNNMDRWLSKLENSKWLSRVQTALSTAGLLAECVERCDVILLCDYSWCAK